MPARPAVDVLLEAFMESKASHSLVLTFVDLRWGRSKASLSIGVSNVCSLGLLESTYLGKFM
jgi:hypothetical protein